MNVLFQSCDFSVIWPFCLWCLLCKINRFSVWDCLLQTLSCCQNISFRVREKDNWNSVKIEERTSLLARHVKAAFHIINFDSIKIIANNEHKTRSHKARTATEYFEHMIWHAMSTSKVETRPEQNQILDIRMSNLQTNHTPKTTEPIEWNRCTGNKTGNDWCQLTSSNNPNQWGRSKRSE